MGDLVVGTAEGQEVVLLTKVTAATWVSGPRSLVAADGRSMFAVSIENMTGPNVTVSAPLYNAKNPILSLSSDPSGSKIAWIEGTRILLADSFFRQTNVLFDFKDLPADQGLYLPAHIAISPSGRRIAVTARSGNANKLFILEDQKAFPAAISPKGSVAWIEQLF